jgi:hypothetical protein
MRLKLICAVLVGVLVIAPGCGSKKKSASTTKAATTSQSTTSSSGGLNLTSADCANLKAAGSTITNASTGKLPSNIAAQVAALQNLAKVAPAAVKADLQTLAAAAAPLMKLNLKAGQTTLTPAQTQQLMKLMSKMNLAKLSQAAPHLSAWSQTACAGK